MNPNIFSDLRKPGLVPGKSLSLSTKIDSVKEKYLAYNMTSRMRSFHMNKESLCLTERQADYVYKAMEKGSIINTKTMTSEMTQNQDDNPYKRVVLNNIYKIPEKCPEMKNWSIFSDNVRYIQHD